MVGESGIMVGEVSLVAGENSSGSRGGGGGLLAM